MMITLRAISLVDDLWRVGNVNIPLSLSVEGASSSLQHHEEVSTPHTHKYLGQHDMVGIHFVYHR